VVAVGVDGCKDGWIAVALRPGGADVHFLPTIDRLAVAVPDATVIGIDIPLAIPDRGPRTAELAARAALGPRRSSIFVTPPRAALAAPTHAEATKLAKDLCGSGCSQQAWRLAPKIFEVEQWQSHAPLYEVHPELSFATMLGAPARANKKTWAGMVERRTALLGAGINLDDAPPEPATKAAIDDMLDAGAAAWSAQRILAGSAVAFADPDDDPIWA
jgi:predicted RNase H-like nuclease